MKEQWLKKAADVDVDAAVDANVDEGTLMDFVATKINEQGLRAVTAAEIIEAAKMQYGEAVVPALQKVMKENWGKLFFPMDEAATPDVLKASE